MITQKKLTNNYKAKTSAPAVHANRVCIIGCGNVGTASAYALAQSGLIRELVLIDADKDKAEGETMDLQQAVAVPMESPVKIINGDYKDAAKSSVVVITAGVATSDPGESRLALLDKNVPYHPRHRREAQSGGLWWHPRDDHESGGRPRASGAGRIRFARRSSHQHGNGD
ncbi:MAG: NAD(P)-binding domain-containing protein [Pyrinomonadaceae bacterium]